MSIARIVLQGRLGRDPELKTLSTGTALLSFSIAVTTGFGEKKHPSWYNCTVFGKRAEALSKLLSKGKEIIVDGKPQMREYTDKDGNKRHAFEVMVDEVGLTSGGQQQQHQAQSQELQEPTGDGGFGDDEVPF